MNQRLNQPKIENKEIYQADRKTTTREIYDVSNNFQKLAWISYEL